MQETLVQFLGWEDPLEKGKANHFNFELYNSLGHKESDMTEQLSLSFALDHCNNLFCLLTFYPINMSLCNN